VYSRLPVLAGLPLGLMWRHTLVYIDNGGAGDEMCRNGASEFRGV